MRKKKWQEQIVDLSRQIDRIGKLLGEAEALAPSRESCGSTASQVFEQAKCQASSLHKAIVNGYTCGCHDHAFKLVLQQTKANNGSRNSDSSVLRVSFPLTYRTWKGPEIPLDQGDQWHTSDTTMTSTLDDIEHSPPLPSSPSLPDRSRSMSGTTLGRPSNISRISSSRTTTTATKVEPTTSYDIHARKASIQESVISRTISQALTDDRPVRISDLCRTIQGRGKEDCLGYLEDGEGACHVFKTSTSFSINPSEYKTIVSLAAVLESRVQGKDKPVELSRRVRLSVAVTLSYALLNLYSTPWFPSQWSKSDIYFLQRKDGQLLTDSPFVLCETMSIKNNTGKKLEGQDEAMQEHADALLSLGIVIMELCFGTAIESRPFWRKHCINPSDDAMKMTALMAAIEWQKQAKDEGGLALHDITHRCVFGNFGMTSMNLDDRKCVGAVYEGVVKPLEGLLGWFWPG